MPFPSSLLFPGSGVFPGVGGGTASYTFIPPYVVRNVPMEGLLRMHIKYGVSVLRINGEWVETEHPTEQQARDADLHFQGGTINQIDATTAQALVAAGYDIVTETH